MLSASLSRTSRKPSSHACLTLHCADARKRAQVQLSATHERLYAPLHATSLTWVETEAQLQHMRQRLAAASEIAIDLESHSYRTYRGFVCLMQISTREEDFLVDTIELRSSLHVLNETFTNPRITKVMHGADSDINWLQRDFGLYVVGLFDTGQAARVLEFQSYALAHLLKHYCGVSANKVFQMADWRIRPLTEEMITCALPRRADRAPTTRRSRADHAPIARRSRARRTASRDSLLARPTGQLGGACDPGGRHMQTCHCCLLDAAACRRYAREDTHYLLYIYDRIKADLAPHGHIAAAWQRSAEICRQAYKVPTFNADAHLVLARRQNVSLTPQQLGVHRALFSWRDAVAREEDESPAYVLPNHQLLRLAQGIPTTPEQLHAVCHPLPALLHYKASSLLATIAAAKAETIAAARTPNNGSAVDAPSCQARGGSAPVAATPVSAQSPAYRACGSVVAQPAGAPACAPAHLHPMQPSLHPSAMPPLPPGPPPSGAGCAPIMAGADGSAHAATSTGANSVRCPPAPTRSPPLAPDQVYAAAGWVPNGTDELGAALMSAGRERTAGLAGSAAGMESDGGGGGGIFFGWSSGSSEDEEFSDGEDTAKTVQQQLNHSPLWVLGMFAPIAPAPSSGGPAATTAPAAGGRDVGDVAAVPRSLTEIYKLSNLNKRRGASSCRRPSEDASLELDETKQAGSDDAGSSSDEGGAPLEEDEDEDEDDGDGSKRRRPGADASEAWAGEASEEATEEFMRRIGWLRPDAEMPTGTDAVAEPPRGVGGGAGARQHRGDMPSDAGLGAAQKQGELSSLPFQRQVPPHLAQPTHRPNASLPQSLAQSSNAAHLGQRASQLGGLPSQQQQMVSSHDAQHSDGGKKGVRARHKKRMGYGNGEFDYEAAAANAPFMYGAMGVGNQAGAPRTTHPQHRGGAGLPGGGHGGGHGGKRPPPQQSGNRSMTFAPAGGQKGGGGGAGGGGRRY